MDLHRFEARMYDPVIARWTSPDPAQQFFNNYIAMANNPANFVDPDGRFAVLNTGHPGAVPCPNFGTVVSNAGASIVGVLATTYLFLNNISKLKGGAISAGAATMLNHATSVLNAIAGGAAGRAVGDGVSGAAFEKDCSNEDSGKKTITSAGEIYDATKLFDTYKTGMAKEEAKGGTTENAKKRWDDLAKQNGCAITLSYCINAAGYIIEEHTTNQNRLTKTGNIKRANNNDKPYEYILAATEMGGYLEAKLGSPTLHLKQLDSDNLDTFIKELSSYKKFKAIIYMKPNDPSQFGGASGHVDLLYEDWGGDAYLKGSNEELDDYLEYRDGGWWLNRDPKLEIFIWILEYE
jgi:predicted outer membrane repeat protein